jgi:predicted TIM-barrel fold metal-dependent hydrolase
MRLATFTAADAAAARRLREWLPERVFDVHVHTCVPPLMGPAPPEMLEYPARLAWEYALCIDDYRGIARRMWPEVEWDGLFFGMPFRFGDIERINAKMEQDATASRAARLFVCRPDTPLTVLEQQLASPSFRGLKPYADLVHPLPDRKLQIADMLPDQHLGFAHEHRLVVMLHLPGEWNVVDHDHVVELRRITRRFPGARIVLAHCALASCPDVAREYMAAMADLDVYFDTSGTAQVDVYRAMLEQFGADRVLFGTDHPVGLVKGRVICRSGRREWDLQPGSPFGPSSAIQSDPSPEPEATFFVQEMLLSLKQALATLGWSRNERDLILFGNADRLLAGVGGSAVG